MLAYNRAAPELAYKRGALFYMRKTDHFIAANRDEIDELICRATLYEKPNRLRALLKPIWASFMLQKRQVNQEMTSSHASVLQFSYLFSSISHHTAHIIRGFSPDARKMMYQYGTHWYMLLQVPFRMISFNSLSVSIR
jgi:hypothetical protein